MYGDLFVRVLNISMISCYTIVVVMVLRALILRWERKYAYLLWFVVFVNLCIPFRISGPFSLVPAWVADFDITGVNGSGIPTVSEGKTDYLPNEQVTEVVTVQHSYTEAEGESGVPGTDSNSETIYIPKDSESFAYYLPNEQITETVTVQHSYTEAGGENGVPGTDSNSETTYHEYSIVSGLRKMLMAVVWGIGIILLTAGNIRAVWKLRSKLKGAEPFSEDNTTVTDADGEVKTADGIDTPFLWGFLSPVIYLPTAIDEEERTYIIAHESYHRKRKDYIFKPLFFVIAVIHWFNPFVWAAYFLFVRDMEISCDEAVIASADGDIRKKYAESLLKYAARQNGYTLTPITFGEPSLKCRIKNVLHYKEKNMILSVLILGVVIAVMAGLVFKPRQTKPAAVPDAQEEPISDEAAVDQVIDREDIEPVQEINWKSGMLSGTDGENQYTKLLMESDMVSGEATVFRTFSYGEDTQEERLTEQDLQSGERSIAYVMAGSRDMEGKTITGSLWRVKGETGEVQHIMQSITMTDTQMPLLLFEDEAYGIINYQTEGGTDGRIVPLTENALSAEIMPDVFGGKRIGDEEGTIICGDCVYRVIDAETVTPVDEYEALQDESDWSPEEEEINSDITNHYQVGWEYELTDAEQMRLGGMIPYYGDSADAFLDYFRDAVAVTGSARRKDAYACVIQLGRTEGFDVYGTNIIDTILVRTPDGKYVRIHHSFSSNYGELPFIYEADFDADEEQELVIMGEFGLHGTGYYQEQLFMVDRGDDNVWRAYELHDDIYLPMIQQHIGAAYSEEKGLELLLDGEGTGYCFAEEDVVDHSAVYAAGAQIRFGYGESGIVPQFASPQNRIVGPKDNTDKKLVLDAMLGVHSDLCVSGIFPGNHFVAEFVYMGDGEWSMTEYHHEFQY